MCTDVHGVKYNPLSFASEACPISPTSRPFKEETAFTCAASTVFLVRFFAHSTIDSVLSITASFKNAMVFQGFLKEWRKGLIMRVQRPERLYEGADGD